MRCPPEPPAWLPQHSRRPAVIRPATDVLLRKAHAWRNDRKRGISARARRVEDTWLSRRLQNRAKRDEGFVRDERREAIDDS